MAEPAIKLFWCGKLERAWSEAEVGDSPPCVEQEGSWKHGPDRPAVVTRKDYGCGWHTLSKNRVAGPS